MSRERGLGVRSARHWCAEAVDRTCGFQDGFGLGGTEKTLAQDLAREVGGSVDENLDIRTDDMLLEVGEHLFEDPDFEQYPLHVGVTAETGREAALVDRGGSPWTLRAAEPTSPGAARGHLAVAGGAVARFGPGLDLQFSKWVWFNC